MIYHPSIIDLINSNNGLSWATINNHESIYLYLFITNYQPLLSTVIHSSINPVIWWLWTNHHLLLTAPIYHYFLTILSTTILTTNLNHHFLLFEWFTSYPLFRNGNDCFISWTLESPAATPWNWSQLRCGNRKPSIGTPRSLPMDA